MNHHCNFVNVTMAAEASFDTNEMSERFNVRGSQNPDTRVAPNYANLNAC